MNDNTGDSSTIHRWFLGFLFAMLGVSLLIACTKPSQPEVVVCGCGTDDHEVEMLSLAEDQDFEINAAKRKVRKVWFAGGAPKGLTESDFQRRVISALSELSEFTATDFVQSASSSGAYVRVYVATNEMMWSWFPSWKPGKDPAYPRGKIPLAAQKGNMVYYTMTNRWGTPEHRYLEGVTLHEFGHRFGVKPFHSTDKTSIMHPDLPVMQLNANDKAAFEKKLGKKLTRLDSKPLGLAA